MFAPINRIAIEKHTANAINKRLLRQTLAITLGVGISTFAMNCVATAQYASGDIPASPWSNRTESLTALSNQDGSRLPNKRLRQPTSVRPTPSALTLGLNAGPVVEPAANKILRPAPVTLMGPKLPVSLTPENASIQENTLSPERTKAASFGKLQESPQEFVPFDTPSTVSGRSRRSLGLPDRVEEKVNSVVESQLASTSSAKDRDEPILIQASSRPQQDERSDMSPIVFPSSDAIADRLAIRSLELNRGPELSQKVESRVDETEMKRIALAERVSHELLSATASDFAGAPQVLESLPGWQAIERELRDRLERCDTLLKRGAVLSAREEASQGLLRLYRTMDLHRGKMYSESAFERAATALREELDFQKTLGGRLTSAVQSIVNTHSTEALKNRPLESTSPEMAAMHYRWYARFQLVEASNGHPWAADLLYAYGRTIEKEAELNPSKAYPFRSQAVVFYQAATQVKPAHSEAASQLGFALIHLDRLDDAYAALSDSIYHKPNANAWNNLAEVFRRRGATAEAEYAIQQASALAQSATQFSSENPEIIGVDPATFAKFSPMPTMTYPSQNTGPVYRSANSNASEMNVRGARSGDSFLSKNFR